MKKLFATLLVLTIFMSSFFSYAGVTSYYDNKKTTLSGTHAMYPAHELLKVLGAKVTMGENGRDFTATIDGHLFVYEDYYEKLTIDDEKYYVDEGLHRINGTLYISLSLVQKVLPIDYSVEHTVKILSPESVKANKEKEEKRFKSMYPLLSKALNQVIKENHTQNMSVKMIIEELVSEDADMQEEFDSVENLLSVELKATLKNIPKDNTYEMLLEQHITEMDDSDVQKTGVLFIDDLVYVKEDGMWQKDTYGSAEKLKQNDVSSFFFKHSNDIEKKRVSDGTLYSLTFEKASIDLLLDALGEDYSSALQLDNLGNEYGIEFKNFNLQVKVNPKGQLISNDFSCHMSLYDTYSESAMVVSIASTSFFDFDTEVLIQSPEFTKNQFNPIKNIGQLVTYNDKNKVTGNLDYKLEDHTLLINAADLEKLMDIEITRQDDQLTIVKDDIEIFFYEGKEYVNFNNLDYKVSAAPTIINNQFYVPIVATYGFIGGAAILEDDQLLNLYTPEYIDALGLKAVQKNSFLKKLEQALVTLEETTYKNDRHSTYGLDNYLIINDEYFSDYDSSYQDFEGDEVEYHDPKNRYFHSQRTMSNLDGYNDHMVAHYLVNGDDFYYAFSYSDDEEEQMKWYTNENYYYENIVLSERSRFNNLKPLLKSSGTKDETYQLLISTKTTDETSKIIGFRQVYDSMVSLYSLDKPIDFVTLKTADVKYVVNGQGELTQINEYLVLQYNDGDRAFDINFVLENTYSDYHKAFKKLPVPVITE